MRIDRISLADYPPIKSFSVDISSNVVIIAGANGSGKTRLKDALVGSFRNPNRPQASLVLRATRAEEEEAWKSKSLELRPGQPSTHLTNYLSTRRRNEAYVGSVVQIDSNRAVQPVAFESFSLATPDPDDEDVSYSWYLDAFILIDEPELHLHPTLAFRLIETLKGFGNGTNQFILFTHSADLISTYYSSGSVFFIDAVAATLLPPLARSSIPACRRHPKYRPARSAFQRDRRRCGQGRSAPPVPGE